MTITYSGNADLEVDCHVGTGIGCEMLVHVYDQNGHKIPGKYKDNAMFVVWVDDDDAPEYAIPEDILSANRKLTIRHLYTPGQIGTGTFSTLSLFREGKKKAQPDILPPMNVPIGGRVEHYIKLERV